MPGNSQYLEWEFEKLKKASENMVTSSVNPVTGGIRVLAPMQVPNTLALIGDSFTARWRNNVQGVGGVTERLPSGFVSWALALSNERLSVISDQSVGGSGISLANTGTNISTTQIDAAIQSGAGHLMVMGGINDAITDATLANTKAAYTVIINKAINAGMRVWICTQPTMNSSYASYSVARQGFVFGLNDWLRQQASTVYAKSGVVLIDCAAVAVDPTSATGNYLTNGSQDNLHPRNIAAYKMGKEVARVWNALVPESHLLLSSNADNTSFSTVSNNILSNGLFVNGAAPGTGFTRSLTGSGGVSSETLVSRADGFGSDLTEVCTFGANNDSVRVTTGDLKANISNGDTIYAECEISCSSMTALRTVRLNLLAQGAMTNFTATTMQLDANDTALTDTYTATLKTNPFTIDTSVLGSLATVQSQVAAFGAGAGGVTLKIGRWSVRKVIAQ